MTQAIGRRQAMRPLHLTGRAICIAMLLCWAGILPVWRLAPGPVQAPLAADLTQLIWPAMALAGGVLFVEWRRLAGALAGRALRLADLALQVGGILFACLALRAVSDLSWAGYGVGWALFGAALHGGAALAASLLPFIALIALVGGLVNISRLQPRAA